MTRNPFEVLGLDDGATVEAAKAAYRRLAEIYHPDRYQSAREDVQAEAQERMRELNAAWDAIRSGRAGSARASAAPPPPRAESQRPTPPESPEAGFEQRISKQREAAAARQRQQDKEAVERQRRSDEFQRELRVAVDRSIALQKQAGIRPQRRKLREWNSKKKGPKPMKTFRVYQVAGNWWAEDGGRIFHGQISHDTHDNIFVLDEIAEWLVRKGLV